MYAALSFELESYWPVQYELLAAILERMDALLVVTLKANGAKNVGKPVRVPRPHGDRIKKPEAVGFGEFMKNKL